MKLIKFINSNENWELLLTESPYFLKIKRDTIENKNYILFMYDQIKSDFTQDIVKESRGLILTEDFKPVCVPFYKFFNLGEPNADEIDWDSAKAYEKLDGSIIKVWHHNVWHISTNGSISAKNASLMNKQSTFFDLFQKAFNINTDLLNKDYTYMFELVSPENRLVVNYENTEIYHLGTRCNKTLNEIDVDINVQKPKVIDIEMTKDSCLKYVEKLSYQNEGLIVKDKFNKRVKVKSPEYVKAHRLVNGVSEVNLLELIITNETDEVVAYFPHYQEQIDKLKILINKASQHLDSLVKVLNFDNRKDLAEYAKSTDYPHFIFSHFDKKKTSTDWLYSFPAKKLWDILREFDNK